jgi:hypothetical protein
MRAARAQYHRAVCYGCGDHRGRTIVHCQICPSPISRMRCREVSYQRADGNASCDRGNGAGSDVTSYSTTGGEGTEEEGDVVEGLGVDVSGVKVYCQR